MKYGDVSYEVELGTLVNVRTFSEGSNLKLRNITALGHSPSSQTVELNSRTTYLSTPHQKKSLYHRIASKQFYHAKSTLSRPK
jgi:hypothetical protein